jgi:hypothetical protein
MWQEIVVYIVGVLAFIYAVRKAFLFFCSKKKQTDHCADCPGCYFNPKKK